MTSFRDIDWGKAACADEPAEYFFPERGHSTARGKDICLGCPVMEQCLDYALTVPLLERTEDEEPLWVEGVWGGSSESERKDMRKRGYSPALPAVA